MKVDNQLKEHLYSLYNKSEIADILHKNSLFGLLGNKFVIFDENDIKVLKKKKIDARYLENALKKTCILMDKNQIEYCTFKGVVIANKLYGNNNCRQLNDIDIFVPQHDFDKAIKILENEGFILKSEEDLRNSHHIVLTNKTIIFELHRNILTPLIGINENYLHKSIVSLDLFDYKIKTFNTTATLLHSIYHLYMDTYLACRNLYSIFANRNYPKAGRFLYRAYEISLFSEKYFNEIKWEDIENDLKHQKLRIIFRIMILDILKIFPEAFPKSFIETVCELSYIDDDRDQFYKYLVESNNITSFDELLCEYINDSWNKRQSKNLHKKVGENISLIKKSSNEINGDLSCDITTEKTIGGLKLVFKVSDYDFYISDMKNYGTQASDGIHLILCGTEQYSYNSVFFFPKRINDEIKIVVCDFLSNTNDLIADNLIKADFSKTDNDYTITAILSNKFLKENHLNSYLYMGLVVSDCSNETHKRKNQLILSEKSSEWYNPIYFARIDIK